MLLLAAFLLPTCGLQASRPLPCAAQASSSGERLVLAFYYPWYDPGTWRNGKTSDAPLEPYNSDDPVAMARHVEQAQEAGLDAFVVNWWGKGNRTDKNLTALLGVAAARGFHVAVDFDLNSPAMKGTAAYADNLGYLLSVHAAHPAYLHYRGRPVLFFFNVSRLPLGVWQKLREQVDPGHDSLWIAEGTDLKYQATFDGHHLYSITWPNRIPPAQTLPSWGDKVRRYNQQHGTAKLWVATVMPGYDDRQARPGSGFARARDGGEYYRQCWQAAIASRADWVVVNSFNEWAEGTAIEPSQAHGRSYIDLTEEWASRFRSADLAAAGKAQAASPTKVAARPAGRARPAATPQPAATPLDPPQHRRYVPY